MSTRILFVHNYHARFVVIDRDLLREKWAVNDWRQEGRLINLPKLTAEIRECDLVFGWFASWHTFWPLSLARRQVKPSILVIGGYDLANLPAIGYGHQRGGIKKWVSRWTMHMATQLITNSRFSQAEAQLNAGIPSRVVKVIYHGVPDPFGKFPPSPREALALTVGNIDGPNLRRKGHAAFVKAAAYLPEVKFVLAGEWRDTSIQALRSLAPPNVTFTGRISDDMLLSLYRRASVYVQASAHEGFGLSVAEAMLAGCIPVVTRAGSLPEVAGDTGIYIDTAKPGDIANAIQTGLTASDAQRASARSRILENFPLEQRRRKLRQLVHDVADGALKG